MPWKFAREWNLFFDLIYDLLCLVALILLNLSVPFNGHRLERAQIQALVYICDI